MKGPAVAALVLGSAAHPPPLLSSTREGDARPSTNAACLIRLWGFAGTATCPHIPFPGGLLRRTPPRVVCRRHSRSAAQAKAMLMESFVARRVVS
ncbi:Os08g0313401 [Oryza sativa Japonica Group]|uniref:Os08g0313401 protein n=1 Tax=Oryza sativa subsp. japonica TaxID=39947 RepID=A0A0P0XEC1_ORYSJ|nr:Os08g0313401 [Oryza sativa Japonica Group]